MRTYESILSGIIFASLAAAQTPNTAAIRGQVLDQSAGAVVSAAVEAVNLDTGLTRRTLTDQAGYYTLADLPLTGEYRLRASAQSLAAKDLDHILLRAGEIATFLFTLDPESGRNHVTVFGTADGVRSNSPEWARASTCSRSTIPRSSAARLPLSPPWTLP